MGYYGYSSEAALYGVEGLGQVTQRTGSSMDAIIQASQKVSQQFAALKNTAAQARAATPGTNEARGVAQTFAVAAKKADAAKKNEAMAKVLAAQGDKRGAAQKVIVALQQARDAIILANKAEKTRLTRALDVMAKQLDAQAQRLSALAEMEGTQRGPTLDGMKKRAVAQSLVNQASALRKKSAAVAALPAAPPKTPTDAKIAELASKYNIRTAGMVSEEQRLAQASVLADLAAAPLAQVKDYEGAWQYYGADGLGKLMADLEFGTGDMPAALQGAVHGVADGSSIAVMADASAAVERARMTVQGAGGLGGLGALGQSVSAACTIFGGCYPDYDRWCDANVPGGVSEAARWYTKDLAKCKKRGTGLDSSAAAPWTLAGRLARGATPSIDQVVKFFAAEATKLAPVAQTVVQSVQQGKTPQQIAQEAATAAAKADAEARAKADADAKAKADAAWKLEQAARDAQKFLESGAAKVPPYVWALGAVALGGVAYVALRPRFA